MSENVTKEAIFNRLLEGKLSSGDAEILVQWLGTNELDSQASSLILEQLKSSATASDIDPAILLRLESRLPLILREKEQTPVRSLFTKKWVRYAAAIIILLGTGLFFLMNTTKESNDPRPVAKKGTLEEIKPGSEGAILTLEDGSTVVLDSLGNGLVTTQGGTKLVMENGQLVYDADQPSAEVGYNTMATPKGRQFQLVLPDGSKVWLNAASSIRYPTVFTGNERRVEITGEAYFEVAHNKQLPFRVSMNNGTEVEVLGTHFNVNSYDNEESINTTLLEGSVLVKNKQDKTILKPGQQAKVSGTEKINILTNVDVEKVMAWKDGVFNFQDATLQEVMRQLERWYDIDVVYEKNIPRLEFFGKMGKDLPLSAVLRGLEKSNVHFRIEAGRRLVVLP